MTTPDLRFPLGKFSRPTAPLSQPERKAMIDAIRQAPSAIRAAINGLSESQLDTPYRPDGWTVRQVVHHMPDSHMNAYCRFKLGLTEDAPTIKPYDEAKWAAMEDGRSKLVEQSLTLLESLHARWVYLLERMEPTDFSRKLNHPEWPTPMTLDTMLALYAWHGKHHTAHITALRNSSGW